MIIEKDLIHYNRCKPYCKGSMLMLGHQYSELGDVKNLFECTEYTTFKLPQQIWDNGGITEIV